MKRRVLYLCLMSVVLLFSVLTERPLLAKIQVPGEVLSALEIKKLVYGPLKLQLTDLYFEPVSELARIRVYGICKVPEI